uniref:MARVEL domain-containing protein n=1 Tax=Heliothis virescens TaxID=7102 RepID=A0A2A4JJA5_HELVI
MSTKSKWYSATKCVCGYSLREGVVIVGISSIIISIATLFTSLSMILAMSSKELEYNSNPVNAINMVFSLFCTSTSMYQATVSIMVLWFGLWRKGSSFVLTLWVVSNISMLTLYLFMFLAKIIVTLNAHYYTQAFLTIIVGIFFEGLFTYFIVIVNSYENSLEPDVIYY